MNSENIGLVLTVIGIVLTVVSLINAWMLFAVKNFRDDVGKLQAADTALGAQLSAISILVAGKYITRDEFTLALNTALDRQTSTILGVLKKE